MTVKEDLKIPQEWLILLYTEAWAQYSHEDDLAQSRTNFFIGVQTAFILIWTALLIPVYDIGVYTISTYRYHLGSILAGVITLLIGLFSLLLTTNWKSATNAGRQYLNLRWISIEAIERLAKVDSIGLASTENRWRKHSNDKQTEKFYPFKGTMELDDLGISSREKIRGWQSMLNVIAFWQITCGLIVVAGMILVLMGFFYRIP